MCFLDFFICEWNIVLLIIEYRIEYRCICICIFLKNSGFLFNIECIIL